jgi:hypothetical protein
MTISAQPAPRRRLSIIAVASAVCGIVLVVPYLAGLVAIGLAVTALRQINALALRGRRLAYAGAFLGLLNIVGWTAYFHTVATLSAPGRAVSERFITDLNAMNLDDARLQCTGAMSADVISSLAQQLQAWGGSKGVVVLNVATDTNNGIVTGSVRGEIKTPNGRHEWQISTVGEQIGSMAME